MSETNTPKSTTQESTTTPESTTQESTTIPESTTQPTYQQEKTYTNEDLDKYRNMSLNFIGTNRFEIIKIYMQHLKQDGPGMLYINLIDTDCIKRVDVSFVKEEVISLEILENVNKRKEKNSDNIIYLLLITPCEDNIIELDIRDLANK
jgi:hypothetical protein